MSESINAPSSLCLLSADALRRWASLRGVQPRQVSRSNSNLVHGVFSFQNPAAAINPRNRREPAPRHIRPAAVVPVLPETDIAVQLFGHLPPREKLRLVLREQHQDVRVEAIRCNG